MKKYQINDYIDKYRIIRVIGKGSFGTVYEAKRVEGKHTYQAAIKVISISKDDDDYDDSMLEGLTDDNLSEYYRGIVDELIEECALMEEMKGDSHIVSYEDHHVEADPNNAEWTIIIRMELLASFAKGYKMINEPMEEKDVIKLGMDICRALETCEKKNNVIHRDIKPENIFISKTGNYKLGDFGIAKVLGGRDKTASKKGTEPYMAPEVFKGQMYDSTVDIYSLGLVLYRLMNRNRAPYLPPAPQKFTYTESRDAFDQRINGGVPFNPPQDASEGFSQVILKACAYDPQDRYQNAQDMRRDLEKLMGVEIETDYPETLWNLLFDNPQEDEGSENFSGSSNGSGSNGSRREGMDTSEEAESNETVVLSPTEAMKKAEEADRIRAEEERLKVEAELRQKAEEARKRAEEEARLKAAAEEAKKMVIGSDEIIQFSAEDGLKLKAAKPEKKIPKEEDFDVMSEEFEPIDMSGKPKTSAPASSAPKNTSIRTANIKNAAANNNSNPKNNTGGGKKDSGAGRVDRNSRSGSGKGKAAIAIAAVAVIAIAAVAVVLMNKNSTMPQLVGLDETEAKDTVSKMGLWDIYYEEEFSNEFDEGIVMEQSIPAGEKITQDSTITLKISSGMMEEMPDVRQTHTREDAENMFKEAGFAVEVVEVYSSVAENMVADTAPAAGYIIVEGEQITLYVSKGPAVMPNIVGTQKDEAVAELESLNVKYNITESTNSDFETGSIISQSVAEATNVGIETTVDIEVCIGPAQIVAPAVVGMLEDTAKQTLIDAGFEEDKITVTHEYDSTVAAGYVKGQDIEATTSVDEGTAITIVVSDGAKPAQKSSGGSGSGSGSTKKKSSSDDHWEVY